MKTIGIVGCGNMGSAIASALAKDTNWEVLVHDTRTEHVHQFAQTVHVRAVELDELLSASSIVVLAVKPQVIGYLYERLRHGCTHISWISLIAGVTNDTLAAELGTEQIVRIQPNIAAQVGKAVTAVVPHPKADPAFIEETFNIVRQFGSAYGIPEDQMAAFTGVSGSAIAACLLFLHAVAMGGVQEGLSYPLALSLIRDTAESATAVLRETGRNPIDLAITVCSPGGMTIEMMHVLQSSGFEGILMDSVEAVAEKVRMLDELAASRAKKLS